METDMEILISVLAGIGVLAIVAAGYFIGSWVRKMGDKVDGFEAWLESHDERFDKMMDRFYRADNKMEDLEERIDGLESLMSDQIMDKIKKK